MSVSSKFEVLKSVAKEFNHAGVIWALGGSMLLYFKGITSEFHDIDIMIMDDDLETVKKIMAALHGDIQPAKPNEKYRTKAFLEYVVSDVDVDIMAGLRIISEDQVVDCSLQANQIVEYIDLYGEKIPLQSSALWCRYYELMGREAKVKLIRDANKRKEQSFRIMDYRVWGADKKLNK